MTEPLVRIEHLSKHFSVGANLLRPSAKVYAVDDVSFEIGRAEIIGLVGESGSGKTTLGRSILRLIEPSSGSVSFDGRSVTGAPKRELRNLRRDMQIVFQDPYATLDPRRRVVDQVQEAFHIHGVHEQSKRREVAVRLLERVGISPTQADRFPHEFSGGQRQRISIARALALNPQFLIADEAVSALDVSIQGQIVNLLMELREELGLTILFISHDLSVIEFVSDRVVVMYLGRVVEIGKADVLYRRPRHPYTRALLDAIPVPDPSRRRMPRPLTGDVPSPLSPPSGCHFRTRCPHAVEACAKIRPELRPVGEGQFVACIRDDVIAPAEAPASIPPRARTGI